MRVMPRSPGAEDLGRLVLVCHLYIAEISRAPSLFPAQLRSHYPPRGGEEDLDRQSGNIGTSGSGHIKQFANRVKKWHGARCRCKERLSAQSTIETCPTSDPKDEPTTYLA